MRATWKGTLMFALVALPVRMRKATDSHDVHFHLLHKECKGRIKNLRYCPACDTTVESDQLMRGWDNNGTLVPIDDELFAELPLTDPGVISVNKFVPVRELTPLMYESISFLEPENQKADRVYSVIAHALHDARVAGIAEASFRQKYRLCAVVAVNKRSLAVITLRFADEIRMPYVSEAEPNERELAIATQLIETMTEKHLNLPEYRDPVQEELLRRLNDAAAKTEVVEVEMPKASSEDLSDLYDALKASIEQVQKMKNAQRRKSA
jgi:DNA end-binding protein Ku